MSASLVSVSTYKEHRDGVLLSRTMAHVPGSLYIHVRFKTKLPFVGSFSSTKLGGDCTSNDRSCVFVWLGTEPIPRKLTLYVATLKLSRESVREKTSHIRPLSYDLYLEQPSSNCAKNFEASKPSKQSDEMAGKTYKVKINISPIKKNFKIVILKRKDGFR